MNTKTRLLLILALSLAVTAVAGPVVSAQVGKEPASFRNVRLWVYPEYDDPRLLMMLEGKIVGAEAPATVRFLVPAAAEMFSAGSKDAQDRYSGGPPRRKPSDVPGWDEISYEVKTDTFRVEYYDPIIKGQPDKKFSYEFRSLYPISDLRVIVLEPRNSSNFAVTPKEDFKGREEGMDTHLYDFRNLDISKPLRFEIAYTRSDPEPSVKNPSLSGAAAESSARPMVIIGILAAVAFVVVFGIGLLSKAKSRTRTRQPLRYAEAGAARSAGAGPAAATSPVPNKGNQRRNRAGPRNRPNRPRRFCSQCGQPLEGSSNFCPECGAKQR